MNKDKIGFIGLGIMGKPMALNLIKAGYSLFVLERNKASGDLASAGAHVFKSNREIAQASDVIITMLPDSPQVEEVVFRSEGILEGMRKETLFIDMSTISPSTARKIYAAMQEIGVEALDAPVSGGQIGAEQGMVSIMAGGNKGAFERAKPIFDVVGKNAVLIGGAGAGQITKACNQIIVGTTIQGVVEALALARKADVDLEKVREALLGGFAQSRILDLHGKRIIENNFKPGFKMKLHRKDMDIALQAAKELSVPLYSSALVATLMDAILAKGYGELDHSSLAKLF